MERLELTHHLAKAITELPDRERKILALYYEEELTLAEIAEVIGVGESRVSQLRTQAIASLRSLLKASIPRGSANEKSNPPVAFGMNDRRLAVRVAWGWPRRGRKRLHDLKRPRRLGPPKNGHNDRDAANADVSGALPR